MKLHSRLTPALLAMTIAASVAYAQDTPAPSDQPQTQARSNTEVDTSSRNNTQRPGQATVADTMLTDGQVLQIVRTLNDAEIKQADEALDQAENPAVKEVAEMIKMDHEQANEQMDELLDGALDLDGSDLNSMLEKEAEATHEGLQDLSGAEYDCAYLEKQVAQHEMAIETAQTKLMPNAKDADVKSFLTAMEPKLEHHMTMAKDAMGKASCQ